MKNIKNLEVIQINSRGDNLYAILSYQDVTEIGDGFNNGYNTIEIPINLRDIQFSHHGCMLVNQSIKIESLPYTNI